MRGRGLSLRTRVEAVEGQRAGPRHSNNLVGTRLLRFPHIVLRSRPLSPHVPRRGRRLLREPNDIVSTPMPCWTWLIVT